MATQKGEELLFADVTFKIRAACFRAWKEFGGAFKEGIVDRALTEALKDEGLQVENQKRIDVFLAIRRSERMFWIKSSTNAFCWS